MPFFIVSFCPANDATEYKIEGLLQTQAIHLQFSLLDWFYVGHSLAPDRLMHLFHRRHGRTG